MLVSGGKQKRWEGEGRVWRDESTVEMAMVRERSRRVALWREERRWNVDGEMRG